MKKKLLKNKHKSTPKYELTEAEITKIRGIMGATDFILEVIHEGVRREIKEFLNNDVKKRLGLSEKAIIQFSLKDLKITGVIGK